MSDRAADGTAPSVLGEKNPRALLKNEDIAPIWAKMVAGQSDADIANEFGVNLWVIREIRNKKRWRHITRKFAHQSVERVPDSWRRARAIWLYKQKNGCSNRAVAEHFGVLPNLVSRILSRARCAEATRDLN